MYIFVYKFILKIHCIVFVVPLYFVQIRLMKLQFLEVLFPSLEKILSQLEF